MIKWKKILIDRSNKITKINKIKNFDDFSGEVEAGGYHPNENYETSNDGSPLVYVCQNYSCNLPTDDINKVKIQLGN